MSGGTALRVDFDAAVSLAIELDFDGPQPRHFGAPPATSHPYVAGNFNGEVSRGASCNCRSLTLIPHCNGTHTESAGHLTTASVPLHRFIPAGPVPALLVTVTPEPAQACGEDTLPAPQAGDRLVTRAALRAAWPAVLPFTPRALVIRTLPNPPGKAADPGPATAPYLSRQAASELVARGIEHLVLDLPSADRSHDEGRLTAHRIFFGLPPGSTTLADASRGRCTITELAYVPDAAADGPCGLQLQVPAFAGDATPSRPLLLPLVSA